MTVLQYGVTLYELQDVDSYVNGKLVKSTTISLKDVQSTLRDTTAMEMVFKSNNLILKAKNIRRA